MNIKWRLIAKLWRSPASLNLLLAQNITCVTITIYLLQQSTITSQSAAR